MSNFRVGQKVVCVADPVRVENDLGLQGFKRGQVLTICAIHSEKEYGYFLEFYERDFRDWGHVSGFRPLVERKTDISIFKAMLEDKKARVRA